MVAHRLGYTYIDTGAMYRAVTLAALRQGIAVADEARVAAVARGSLLRLLNSGGVTRVLVDGGDVTEAIRSPEVSRAVSGVSKIAGVRAAMVEQQRQLADGGGGVVLDGRDIGTHVLPNADIKIFLTASITERARRRWLELQEKGYLVDIAELQAEIACRDQADRERSIAPLIQAEDAVLIDTTGLSIENVVEQILELCEAKSNDL